MINLSRDIHSLTDFKRNTTEFVQRLKQTKHPLVLTVNGKAELVIQDAESYQKLLDAVEFANLAGSYCVTKEEVIPALPTREELLQFKNNYKESNPYE